MMALPHGVGLATWKKSGKGYFLCHASRHRILNIASTVSWTAEAPQTERLIGTENWTFLGWDSA